MADLQTLPPSTVPAALANAVRRWPDKTYLDFSGVLYSFAQADALSTRLAHGLRARGVAKGDRICALLDNSEDMIFLMLAVAKLGAVIVPINTAFRGEFLRHQIADTGAQVIIVEPHYAGNVVAIAEGVPELRLLAHRDALEQPVTAFPAAPLSSLYLEDDTPVEVDVAPGDLAMLLYTSGTTGPSKGCMISQNYICNSAYRSTAMTGVREEDIYWTPCPLFHMAALSVVFGSLQIGATASIAPRFSVSNFWPEIERSRASVILILSSMITLVADAPDNEIAARCHGQIRTAMGAPFTPELQEKWARRFGVRYSGALGFGMTEATPMTAHFLEQPRPAGTSGRRYADFDVQIVNDKDEIQPAGVAGEVVIRPQAPHVMFSGYWRRPEATVEALRNVWFHTGDIGRFDDEGFFTFVDRKKDYLRRGGENISSFELEVVFRAHPDIVDVAIHAVLSERSEDEVKATVILCEGAQINEEGLCRWSIERLPHFAVPRYIEFRPELPRNGVGRVLKYELRAQGVTTATWDREKAGVVVERQRKRA